MLRFYPSSPVNLAKRARILLINIYFSRDFLGKIEFRTPVGAREKTLSYLWQKVILYFKTSA
jgi:hypothetical protein